MNKILLIGANSSTGKSFYYSTKDTDDEFYFCDLVDAYDINLINRWHKIDLTCFDHVSKTINDIMPDKIYNFAGTFSNDYDIDYRANVLLPKYIFDSIIQARLKARVLLIGSAAEYGKIDTKDNPIREDHPLNPVSIYGLTKVYQTHLMKYYFNSKGIDVVMARPSNLLGKGFSNKLFIGSIYDQIEQFMKGIITEIQVGNLENKRDYISIDDAVRDYQIIMEHGQSGETYNVAKGKSVQIKTLLEKALLENNIPLTAIKSTKTINSNKFDIKDIWCDITKLSEIKNRLRL